MSVEDFLSTGLPLLDNDIGERVRKASLNGNVLRYVCVIEGSRYSNIFTQFYQIHFKTLIKSATYLYNNTAPLQTLVQ